MGPALGRANQKLYHAAILTRLLSAERAREQVPLAVLLDAIGVPARQHLLDAYGWLLVALVDPAELPQDPPGDMDALVAAYGLSEPLRGELVELRQLEATGWLGELVSASVTPGAAASPVNSELSLVARAWDDGQLEEWRRQLEDLIDRLSHGLDEW